MMLRNPRRMSDNERGSTTLPEPRQHLQPAVPISRQQPHLGLIVPDRLHGVVADPAICAPCIESCLCEAYLHFMSFAQRHRAFGAGEGLDERRCPQNAVV